MNGVLQGLNLAALEQQHGLPAGLLTAVAMAESGGKPDAVSPKGAQGLFQFMPKTAEAYGIDPFDPQQAAQGAARMYADLSKQYGGDIKKMLAGYNWGSGNLAKHGFENVPEETKGYINKIMDALPMYQYADSGQIMNDAGSVNERDIDAEIAKLESELGGATQQPNEASIDAEIAKLEAELSTKPQAKKPAVDTSLDVAKSIALKGIPEGLAAATPLGIGLNVVRGVSDLARLGGGKLYELATGDKLQQFGTNPIPTSSDVIGSALKKLGGVDLYEPQTRAGKFANTITQFGVGGGATGIPLSSSIPAAVASEAAGQAAEGTGWEAPARVLAALGGGVAGSKLANPIKSIAPTIPKENLSIAKRAQEMGIQLRADQLAPTRVRNTLQKISQELPFSGVDAGEELARAQWNRQLAKTIGQDADVLTPEVINKFTKDASEKFSSALSGKTIDVSGLGKKASDVVSKLSESTTGDMIKIVKKNAKLVAQDIADGTISGEKLASLRSRLLQNSTSAPSGAKQGISELIDAIDVTVANQMDVATRETLKQARKEWRNFKTIEPLLEGSVTGEINPTDLMARVKSSKFIKSSRSNVGSDDLVDLARIGKLMAKKGGSDTAQKLGYVTGGGVITGLLTNPVATIAALTGGAGIVGTNRALQALNRSPRLIQQAISKTESPQSILKQLGQAKMPALISTTNTK